MRYRIYENLEIVFTGCMMIQKFYDELSPFYHLIRPDWDASIESQTIIMNRIIKSEWGENVSSIVDVSCGIGTQAIGLAKHGYEVEASDLSPQSIGRARKEAKTQGVDLKFSVSDMRKAYGHLSKQFDVLISCDNSVPHPLSDGEILKAFKEFYRCLKPGGGCLVTLRDCAKEPRDGIQFKSYGVRVDHGVRYVIFQTWEFYNDIYDMPMYVIYDDGVDHPVTKRFRSQYYAVSLPTILGLMQKAGFQDVKDIECDFYQPVIVGTRKI